MSGSSFTISFTQQQDASSSLHFDLHLPLSPPLPISLVDGGRPEATVRRRWQSIGTWWVQLRSRYFHLRLYLRRFLCSLVWSLQTSFSWGLICFLAFSSRFAYKWIGFVFTSLLYCQSKIMDNLHPIT